MCIVIRGKRYIDVIQNEHRERENEEGLRNATELVSASKWREA